MRKALNDNEPNDWQLLSCVNKRVTTRLEQNEHEHHEEGRSDGDQSRAEQEKSEERRRYVAKRLRDLAAFERRASGRKI
jgi:hypothetical protein